MSRLLSLYLSAKALLVSLYYSCLRMLLAVLGPRVSGSLIAALASKDRIKKQANSFDYTVFCCNRPQFEKDLNELEKNSSLRLVRINNRLLGEAIRTWLPPEVCVQTDFQKYESLPEYKSAWEQVDKFSHSMLKTLVRKFKIDAILVAHACYWQPQGLRRNRKHFNLPYLVLCRELPVLPSQQKTDVEFYLSRKFKFDGEGLAVLGQNAFNWFKNSDICDPNIIEITGGPRWDAWINNKAIISKPKRDTITLLSFLNPAYGAPNTFKKIVTKFSSIAKELEAKHQNIKFLIKCKDEADMEAILKLVPSPPSNLHFTYSKPLPEVFSRSRVVIGFNTMALIEALYCSANLLIPYLEEAKQADDMLMLSPNDPEVKQVCGFFKSMEELKERIEQSLVNNASSDKSDSAKQNILTRFIYMKSDELASERVYRFISNHIESSKNSTSSSSR